MTETARNVKYYALTNEAISVISEKIKINGTSYSEAILDTISMLKNLISSQKDRRISKMLSNALRRGVITKDDYIEAGELTKWNTDMQFVV